MPRISGWNDGSRMATVQSLVEESTLIIDNSNFITTQDKVFIKSHYYSDKPVMPSILGAIVYFPLYHFGMKLDWGWNFAGYLIILFTIKLFWVLGLVAFNKSLKFTEIEDKYCRLITLALGFGSLYFTWSSTFNNHSLAASFLIIGFYFVLKAKHNISIKKNLLFSGFFFSLAGTCDQPMAVFFFGFCIYILLHSSLSRNIVYFLLPAIVTIMPAFMINYHISGSLVPVQLVKSNFEYPGSPWIGTNRLSGVTMNSVFFIPYYAFKVFLGPRGFLIYNPLLFIVIPQLFMQIRKGEKLKSEAIIIGITSIIIVSYYLIFTSNSGGWSYGIRWFVPLLPLLFFFMFSYFKNFDFKKRRNFLILFSISIIISVVGLINPWSDISLSRIAIFANLIELYHFVTM